MTVYLELDEKDKHLELTYGGYVSPDFLKKIKQLPARFKATPYAHWRMKAEIETAKQVKALFGDQLEMSPRVKRWANKILRKSRNLAKIATADSAELKVLPKVLPELAKKIHVGPRGKTMTKAQFAKALKEPPSFQTADVAFMARAEHPMNLNQPGTGKTYETIACVYEAEMEQGPKLIVAPLTSLEVVWVKELEENQHQPVLVFGNSKEQRLRTVAKAMEWKDEGKDFWLVVNPQSFQLQRTWNLCPIHQDMKDEGEKLTPGRLRQCSDCAEVLESDYPDILSTFWSVLIIDEFHKMGLGNAETLTYQTLDETRAAKKIILSGTPIGGVPIKLYYILSFLYPDLFPSKWRFANTWLEVTEDSHEKYNPKLGRKEERKTKNIGDVREDKADEFYEMLSAYMVRRTKEECLPWLPKKLPIDIWAVMSGKQRKQYEEFALEAEIRIDDEELNATSILAEYMRLKQFANATQTILGRNEDGKPIVRPTTDSCKLPHVYEILEERGIAGRGQSEGDAQVVIFSQFTQIVDMVCGELQRLGYSADKLTGATTQKNRRRLVEDFQAGKIRVLVMNIEAGGVSITLDNADTVIHLDETWNPDDQEQGEDRTHRGAKVRQVTVYTIRTKGTIEEYVQTKVLDKSRINSEIFDLRRMGLRSIALGH